MRDFGLYQGGGLFVPKNQIFHFFKIIR
jgi:hypothetical protein